MKKSKNDKLYHSGVRLRSLRELQGENNFELAAALGVETSIVQDWEENGIPENYYELCVKYFDIPVSIFTNPVSSEHELNDLISSGLFLSNDAKIDDLLANNRSKKCEILDLSGLNLDEIPEEVFSYTWLKKLDLSNNKIRYVPSRVLLLENLEAIDLSSNLLRKPPGLLINLKNINTIDISNNFIELDIFNSPISFKEYKKYVLESCSPVAAIFDSISIETLDIVDELAISIEKGNSLVVYDRHSEFDSLNHVACIVYLYGTNDLLALHESLIGYGYETPLILIPNTGRLKTPNSLINKTEKSLAKKYRFLKIIDDISDFGLILKELNQHIVTEKSLPKIGIESLILKNIGTYEDLLINFNPDLTVMIGLLIQQPNRQHVIMGYGQNRYSQTKH